MAGGVTDRSPVAILPHSALDLTIAGRVRRRLENAREKATLLGYTEAEALDDATWAVLDEIGAALREADERRPGSVHFVPRL